MLNLMNLLHKENLRKEDITTWDFFQQEKYRESFWSVVNLYDTTYLRRAIPPMDTFVVSVVKHLQKSHEIPIVTMNQPACVPSIKEWLFVHGIDAEVIAVGRNAFSKADLPFDLFIDDAPKVIEHIIEKYPHKVGIIFDQPWNQNIRQSVNVFRAKTWLEVLNIFENKIQNEKF